MPMTTQPAVSSQASRNSRSCVSTLRPRKAEGEDAAHATTIGTRGARAHISS